MNKRHHKEKLTRSGLRVVLKLAYKDQGRCAPRLNKRRNSGTGDWPWRTEQPTHDVHTDWNMNSSQGIGDARVHHFRPSARCKVVCMDVNGRAGGVRHTAAHNVHVLLLHQCSVNFRMVETIVVGNPFRSIILLYYVRE